MHPNDKIFATLREIETECNSLTHAGTTKVLTSGCFDLIHGGHLEYLCRAKEQAGNRGSLVVGVNSDEFTRWLKGPTRPVRKEADRAFVVAGFFPVDLVIVFGDDLELIKAVRPNIYVASKTSETRIHDDRERVELLERLGAAIVELEPCGPDNTAKIIERTAAVP